MIMSEERETPKKHIRHHTRGSWKIRRAYEKQHLLRKCSTTVNTEDQINVQRDIAKNFSRAWTFSFLWRIVFKMSLRRGLRGQYKYMYLGYSDGVRFRWLVLPKNFLCISVHPLPQARKKWTACGHSTARLP